MVKRITLQELEQGLLQTAQDFENPKEPSLDFRVFKQQNLQQYWSAVIQIQFSPASIGKFSRGRGRKIRLGDRYGQATSATRRAITRGFSIKSGGGKAEIVFGTGQPEWSKYFDKTLRRRRIGQFIQGILPWFPIRDNERLLKDGASYVVETVDKNL